MTWEGPKWAREVLFPANPNLANILGDTYFDFRNLIFGNLDPNIPDFQAPDFQKSSLGQAWAGFGPWAKLGLLGWAGGGPGGPSGGPSGGQTNGPA